MSEKSAWIKNIPGALKMAFLTLALSVLTGFALLLLVFSLPTENIWRNVSKSLDILTQETDYFSVTPGVGGSVQDNFTEAIYLNEALVGKEDGLIRAALSGFTYSNANREGNTPVEQLLNALDEPRTKSPTQVRFWAGYEVFLKPFLTVADYASVRQFNLLTQFLLIFFLFRAMEKRGLQKYRLPLFMAYLLMNPVSLGLCMTFAGFFYCIFVPCLLMTLFHERLKIGCRYWMFFELIGVCVIYFNMNYFQLASFGIPFIFYCLLDGWPKTWRELFRIGTPFFAAWAFGFAGMMVSKWILYAVFVDSSIFAEMSDKILSRVSSSNLTISYLSYLGVDTLPDGILKNCLYRLLAICINVYPLAKNPLFFMAESALIAYCLLRFFRRKGSFGSYKMEACLTLILSLMVVARYAMFTNHTLIHYWVTYRLYAIPLFSLNVLLTNMAFEEKNGDENYGKIYQNPETGPLD